MLDKRFGVLVKSTWEWDFTSENVFVDSHWVFIIKWIDSCVHFVNKNSQSPPIDSLSVALVQDDFRGDVLRGTANGKGSAFIEDFGESEISQFEVSIVGDEKIFGFEVSEDNIFAMKVFEARGNGGCIESGLISGEGLDWSEISEKLTSIDEFENQVKILGVLSKSFKVNDEGVTDLGMDEVFIINVIDLLGFDDFAFVEQFEGNVFSCFFVFGHLDFTETTLTEDSSDFVVFELELSDALSFSFLHGMFKINYNQSKKNFAFIFSSIKIWLIFIF